MIKGCCVGIRKRALVLRKAMFPKVIASENSAVALKFIDTSSKFGHGRFQTTEDKRKFFGKIKETRTVKVQRNIYIMLKRMRKRKVKFFK